MDSGCLEPGESLDEKFDTSRNFLPGELIWLMDELTNREARMSVLTNIELTTFRSHGLWAIPYLKHCSPPCMLIVCSGQSRRALMRAPSYVAEVSRNYTLHIKFFELTVFN